KSTARERDEYGDTIYTLSFPNEEIRLSMRELVLRVTLGREDSQEVPIAMKSLAQGDVAPFTRFVKEYLITTISYFDFHKEEKEKSYHLLILGMVAYFANTHHARSNRESGTGRYDISLEPKNKARKGIIMELKVAKEGEDLKKVAQDAFEQIQKQQYKKDMEARGIKDFVIIGIAFRGKDMEAVDSY
ncbi:MAG: PD-(D/E)XK nuclease domain-containing protein, partial [Bacteroidota bacterium]